MIAIATEGETGIEIGNATAGDAAVANLDSSVVWSLLVYCWLIPHTFHAELSLNRIVLSVLYRRLVYCSRMIVFVSTESLRHTPSSPSSQLGFCS